MLPHPNTPSKRHLVTPHALIDITVEKAKVHKLLSQYKTNTATDPDEISLRSTASSSYLDNKSILTYSLFISTTSQKFSKQLLGRRLNFQKGFPVLMKSVYSTSDIIVDTSQLPLISSTLHDIEIMEL